MLTLEIVLVKNRWHENLSVSKFKFTDLFKIFTNIFIVKMLLETIQYFNKGSCIMHKLKCNVRVITKIFFFSAGRTKNAFLKLYGVYNPRVGFLPAQHVKFWQPID